MTRVGKRGIAIAAAALVMLGGCSEPPPKAEAPVRPVRTAAISYRSTAATATYPGEVKARFEAPLGFRVAGKIVARKVQIGDLVQPGQVIAALDPSDLDLRHRAATAAVAAAQATYVQTHADLARYRELLARGNTAKADYDRRLNAFRVAEAALQQAKADLATAANQLDYAQLTADTLGIVTAVLAEAGQVVAAGTPVVRLARPEEIEVAVDVPENRLDEIRKASRITASLWSDRDRTLPARLREIAPNADPVSRTYAVRVSLTGDLAGVGLGMTATVSFRQPDGRVLAAIPATALYRLGERPAVWVFDRAAGTVALAAVEVARYGDHTVLLSGGVPDGTLIVTAGVHKLEPGQKVRDLADGPRGEPKS